MLTFVNIYYMVVYHVKLEESELNGFYKTHSKYAQVTTFSMYKYNLLWNLCP